MTSLIERAGMAVLSRIDPERAHDLALAALRRGLAPLPRRVTSERLRVRLAGLELDNPVGLAAGFDKNAVALAPLCRAGFGFVETGAVTPRPQPGNPRPRLFRLPEDGGVINRFGFNNDGAEAIAARLGERPRPGVIGLNLGANKDSPDRAADYAAVLTCFAGCADFFTVNVSSPNTERLRDLQGAEALRAVLATCGAHVDFATVNVSSPNTERLRELQGPAALAALLEGVKTARATLPRPIPLFLKIAPDLGEAELAAVAETALGAGIDGIIATNTTLARDGLRSPHAAEAGGLSGRPLMARSTRVLAQLSLLTEGQLPLIGVGGIASAEDAYAKIRAGATAVQLYSALALRGLSLLPEILEGLDRLLARDGFASTAEAVGTDRARWAQG